MVTNTSIGTYGWGESVYGVVSYSVALGVYGWAGGALVQTVSAVDLGTARSSDAAERIIKSSRSIDRSARSSTIVQRQSST